jgi:hypothetical protein
VSAEPYSEPSEAANRPRGDQDPQEGGGCYLYTPSPSHTKFYARQAN